MAGMEDDISQLLHNPYAWSEDSDIALDEFLKKYKPSMVQNDGSKPWIWVRRSHRNASNETEDRETAVAEATALLKEVTAKVESIKNDASIPARTSKKTGVKGKKEVREQVQAEATEKLKEIAIRNKYTHGKWLIFASSEKVDLVWSHLATSLVSGPLAGTAAYGAKVSTSPAEEKAHNQHLICIYMPDIYDVAAVTEVMKVLLRYHGANLTGVKGDLYTLIGLDSKHPSGVSSTAWKPTQLLKDAEIKELKDAFFADLAAPKTSAGAPKDAPADPSSASAEPSKSKPKPKAKKTAKDDPFASDDDADEEEAERKKNLKSLKKAPAAGKRPKESDDDDEEAVEPKFLKKKRTSKK